MSSELGPIEIECEAPPYPVVRACRRLGFRRPEDVRWCRVRRAIMQPGADLFGELSAAARVPCSCGTALPRLESYTFTFVSGSQSAYYLAQCERCRTVYWDNASPG